MVVKISEVTTVRITRKYQSKIDKLQSKLLTEHKIKVTKKKLLELIIDFKDKNNSDFLKYVKQQAKHKPVTKNGVILWR